MEHDHKYSGTLPLLAYAPHDFGVHAQRSRAYRARAAMGRTGVQPLRSHAQAPKLSPKPNPVSTQSVAAPVADKPLYQRIWARISAFLRPAPVSDKQVPHDDLTAQQQVAQSAKIIAPNRQENLSADYANVHDLLKHRTEMTAETIQAENAVSAHVEIHPVSKTYAAMRMQAMATSADDQAIPQAADLSHALAEVRQALREYERQAALKQNEYRLS